MALFNSPTDGFIAADFDVYRQECWSSNVHNLQRMKTKEKLLSVVKRVATEMTNSELAVASSSEIPSVWNGRQVREQLVYFSRDASSQKRLQAVITREFDLAERIKAGAEHERHLILFARIDAQRLTVGLRFTRFSLVDNRNLLHRLKHEPETCDKILEALKDSVFHDGESVDRVRLVDALEALGDGRLDALELSRHWIRDAVIDEGDALEEALRNALADAGRLFEAALWTTDNDQLSLTDTLDEIAKQLDAALVAKNEEREAKAVAHAERAAVARERTNAKVAAEQAWRKMQQTRRPKQEDDKKEAEIPEPRQRDAHPPKSRVKRSASRSEQVEQRKRGAQKSTATKKAARSKAPRKSPKKEWQKGDECTLSRGLFAGKRGIVTAKPAKGYVKVKVGVIEVNVSVLELDL